MSGIIGSKLNIRGSGLVGSLGTDGQHLLSAGAGKTNVFETAATTDLTPVRQDLTTLALKQAVNENKAAFNLPNTFIDQFENDTGIQTETTGDRNSSEYWGSTVVSIGAFPDDSNTVMLLHMEDVGLTDSSSNEHVMTLTSGCTRSSTAYKYGSYSANFDGTAGNSLTPASDADFAFGTGDWTWEFWMRPQGSGSSQTVIAYYPFGFNNVQVHRTGATGWNYYVGNTSAWSPVHGGVISSAVAEDTFTNIAITRDSNTIRAYMNGVQKSSASCTGFNFTQTQPYIGENTSLGEYVGYVDELRVSDTCRYPDGTSYTAGESTTVNATGTVEGITSVPSAAQTKVSGVMNYKDNAGTASIGTDLKIYFSCDGGSGGNWTEASSYTAVTPVFSTGIKMVKLGETTCTSGSAVRYKAVFANQSASKDTHLYGIGVNY